MFGHRERSCMQQNVLYEPSESAYNTGPYSPTWSPSKPLSALPRREITARDRWRVDPLEVAAWPWTTSARPRTRSGAIPASSANGPTRCSTR